MKPYNGHRSYNAWQVSLWLSNDESLYRRAMELVKRYGRSRAASKLLEELPAKTPDGAPYCLTNLRLALRDF